MRYCIEHSSKAYTERQFKTIKTCENSGVYQDIGEGLIRVYCFRELDIPKAKCPHEKEDK